jgi:LuxR family maltose regulon positive regulatory protein
MPDSINPQLIHWFPQTKLCPPLIAQDILPRPHLLDHLRQVVASQRLTLISAPAGYGKTTLLALLSAPDPEPSLPLAWLSLDDEDNDFNRFLLALIAALQRLSPACGVIAQTLLTGPVAFTDTASPTDKVRRVIGVLINEILTELPQSFTLALDDLHQISEPIVYLALDYLLERLPWLCIWSSPPVMIRLWLWPG